MNKLQMPSIFTNALSENRGHILVSFVIQYLSLGLFPTLLCPDSLGRLPIEFTLMMCVYAVGKKGKVKQFE